MNMHILVFMFIFYLGFIPMLFKDPLFVFFLLESLIKICKEATLPALLQVEIAEDIACFGVCVCAHTEHCLDFLPSSLPS